jgi:hypothetical protein
VSCIAIYAAAAAAAAAFLFCLLQQDLEPNFGSLLQ